jgi:hypothetical protein
MSFGKINSANSHPVLRQAEDQIKANKKTALNLTIKENLKDGLLMTGLIAGMAVSVVGIGGAVALAVTAIYIARMEYKAHLVIENRKSFSNIKVKPVDRSGPVNQAIRPKGVVKAEQFLQPVKHEIRPKGVVQAEQSLRG